MSRPIGCKNKETNPVKIQTRQVRIDLEIYNAIADQNKNVRSYIEQNIKKILKKDGIIIFTTKEIKRGNK